ncbi:hypothetical protein PRIP_16282 [Listeria riparia FSL S10-1204]|uniref:Uncharacterized protein n=1 Tax=Listeria riparia FSL S10-1204 TaxID=1265816 RepID=W7CS40_9LIST|nr:hypothetical protein PRIP_16282 [Listeria riparia FSL S10-1204]
MEYHIYLAGEIHSDWRNQLRASIKAKPGITFHFWGPQENHDLSDAIGEHVLGEQPNAIYKDLQASKINNLRTELHLKKSRFSHCLIRREIQTMEYSNRCSHSHRAWQTNHHHSPRTTTPPAERTIRKGKCDGRND